jgi:cysteinyl-tRNA synthetase
MNEVPQEILALAARREEARRARDFATADAIREQIREAGFQVTDAPAGPEVAAAAQSKHQADSEAGSGEVASLLDRPPSMDASIQWVVQGWPEDVLRGIESFRRHCGRWSMTHVIADLAGTDPPGWPEDADVITLPPEAGWSAGRNAALTRATGRIVILVDGSVEALGDVVEPLAAALEDPAVCLTGPFGIVTDDLRHFHEASGPDCDAVEGYLMAFRRELVEEGLRFDEKFKFYRTADIELSFQVKAKGLRATVTPAPAERHEHRMWAHTPEEERDRLSKRNFYRFLDRWRGRTDLLVGGRA